MSDAYDRWQRIFASSAAGFVVHVDGVIADINETAIKILGGADKNDFIGKRFMEDFIHPDFHPIIKLRREQLKSGGQVLAPVEMRIRRLDGFLVDVLSAATGILSGESLYVEVLLIDITSVKRRERLLEAFSEMMNITTEEQNPLDIKGVTVGDNFPVLVGENFPVSCP
jgi:PAS domain S-box-containing protein